MSGKQQQQQRGKGKGQGGKGQGGTGQQSARSAVPPLIISQTLEAWSPGFQSKITGSMKRANEKTCDQTLAQIGIGYVPAVAKGSWNDRMPYHRVLELRCSKYDSYPGAHCRKQHIDISGYGLFTRLADHKEASMYHSEGMAENCTGFTIASRFAEFDKQCKAKERQAEANRQAKETLKYKVKDALVKRNGWNKALQARQYEEADKYYNSLKKQLNDAKEGCTIKLVTGEKGKYVGWGFVESKSGMVVKVDCYLVEVYVGLEWQKSSGEIISFLLTSYPVNPKGAEIILADSIATVSEIVYANVEEMCPVIHPYCLIRDADVFTEDYRWFWTDILRIYNDDTLIKQEDGSFVKARNVLRDVVDVIANGVTARKDAELAKQSAAKMNKETRDKMIADADKWFRKYMPGSSDSTLDQVKKALKDSALMPPPKEPTLVTKYAQEAEKIINPSPTISYDQLTDEQKSITKAFGLLKIGEEAVDIARAYVSVSEGGTPRFTVEPGLGVADGALAPTIKQLPNPQTTLNTLVDDFASIAKVAFGIEKPKPPTSLNTEEQQASKKIKLIGTVPTNTPPPTPATPGTAGNTETTSFPNPAAPSPKKAWEKANTNSPKEQAGRGQEMQAKKTGMLNGLLDLFKTKK